MKPSARAYSVHKFGGSSVADASRFKAVKEILSGNQEIIVVSATKGTTSRLQNLLDNAAAGNPWQSELLQLQQQHQTIVQELFPKNSNHSLLNLIHVDFTTITHILNTIEQTKIYSQETQDLTLGYGEQISAQILAAYLAQEHNTLYLDATTVLFSYKENGVPCIDWQRSSQAVERYCAQHSFEQLVITGFIAATLEGKRTTLGRNGSDFSGAIFARLFHASKLIIWTDVDGIYTAHPAQVKTAVPIDNLSYTEAAELAFFGANVLHPLTIAPAQKENIPIYIKNSYNPTASGTMISQLKAPAKNLIQGLSYIDNLALITIDGTAESGVQLNAPHILQLLYQANLAITVISNLPNSNLLCIALNQSILNQALSLLNTALKLENRQQSINSISIHHDCAILAAVGEKIAVNSKVNGKFFASLAQANINIHSMIPSSSKSTIAVVLKRNDINQALQTIHDSFYAPKQLIAVGLIGPGEIGSALLDQIAANRAAIKTRYQVDICVRAIINNHKMLLSADALAGSWHKNFMAATLKPDLEQFSHYLLSADITHTVIIDCTASSGLAQQYLKFLNLGIHIITPNKHANAGAIDYYQQIKQAASNNHCYYLYEATVCAGLPVINTLQDLIKTGDEILAIEGVVSGTLSYIFNELASGRLFSEIVLEAMKLGYTEPDPREDLSGQDVARKLVCLARELGYSISINDIEVYNLVPPELRTCPKTEFVQRLPQFDAAMIELVTTAQKQQQKLCYSGKIQADGLVKVTLKSIDQTHPLARLNGSDNIIIFHSKRYNNGNPMIIQGPGAGAQVTAAGVFADLLRLTSYLY
jgi:aspartokinase/homoserine dehydrogenase 1